MDLFDAIGRLFTKEPIEDPPPDYMLHRFLASDVRFASVASDLNLFCRDRDRVWQIWKDALPKTNKAPYLKYPAPKKQATNEIVEKYAKHNQKNMTEAEDEIRIIEKLGKLEDLKTEMGLE